MAGLETEVRPLPKSRSGHQPKRGRECRLLARFGSQGHAASTSGLPPTSDIRWPMPVIMPFWSALPPATDVPGGVAVRLVLPSRPGEFHPEHLLEKRRLTTAHTHNGHLAHQVIRSRIGQNVTLNPVGRSPEIDSPCPVPGRPEW